jgi:arylsulfatase A-like enzyme
MRRKLRHDRGVLCLRRLAAPFGALLLLVGCTSSGPDQQNPTPRSDKPNIVLVLADGLTRDLIRFMPHVIDLQRSGTTLTNYFVTGTDRSPIFTGRYAHNAKPAPYPTFATALHRAGYRTGMLGKYLPGFSAPELPAADWDEWDVASRSGTGFNYDLSENGTVHHYGHAREDYLTDVLTDKAGTFITDAAHAHVPFALVVAATSPGSATVPAPRDANSFPGLGALHGPAFGRLPTNPPKWMAGLPPLSGDDLVRLDANYERRVEAVQSVDTLMRRIGRALHANHVAGNTYVVFSSGEGYHLGGHRLRAGTGTAFDSDIQVPLVVRGPDVPANATIDALSSSVDLAPTFFELAGVRGARAHDGVSLDPLWHGLVPSGWQQAVLVEHAAAVPGQPDVSGKPPHYAAVRTANSVFVSYADGTREYYNLARDPDELHNVAGKLSARQLARQRAALAALTECQGSTRCQAAARSR